MKQPKYTHQLMDRVSRMAFSRHFSLLEQIDIHPGQVPLLMFLNSSDGMTQAEIANHLFVSAPTINVSVKRLEKAGLIEKRADENDARMIRIYITEMGKDTANKLDMSNQKLEDEMFEGFTPEEKMLFRRLLMQIRDNLFMQDGGEVDLPPMKHCKGRRND
ncbi:MAG: MarR family transcriptional regulator [Anaerofustis stercorihominis]|nr:MarR family transcriptional regulator [Anaerofustis stercorihominis]